MGSMCGIGLYYKVILKRMSSIGCERADVHKRVQNGVSWRVFWNFMMKNLRVSWNRHTEQPSACEEKFFVELACYDWFFGARYIQSVT